MMQQADLFQNPPAAMRPMPAGRTNPFPSDSARPARNALTGHPDQRGRRDTSKDALACHRETGKLSAQQQQVFAVLTRTVQAFTRAELAAQLGMTHGAACGRVNELMKLGLIVETERRTCLVTGASSHGVRVK